ncbi:MAG: hypothetical protein JXR51_10335 [Bacteroidales bacterium]|nr:hypothetical protein [Bacteroidales bacterium]MBN2757563.1 hypothetical protein [Bacteroidales bacterium]
MCKFDNHHIVEELKNELGFGWHVYPVNIHSTKLNFESKQPQYQGNIYCVHCKSKKIIEVHTDSYKTISGKATEWVFKCSDCNKYMTVEHEIINE